MKNMKKYILLFLTSSSVLYAQENSQPKLTNTFRLKNSSSGNFNFQVKNASGRLNCLTGDKIKPGAVEFILAPNEVLDLAFDQKCVDDYNEKIKNNSNDVANDLDYLSFKSFDKISPSFEFEAFHAFFRFEPNMNFPNGISFSALIAKGDIAWSWKGQTQNYVPITFCNTKEFLDNGYLCPEN